MTRRKAKEATPAYLRRVALWYLERYGGTTARLRGALERRVRRSVAELGTDPEMGAAAIEQVIADLVSLGLVDDGRFAESRVSTLRRRGKSRRAIVAVLRRQGVAMAVIERALGQDDGAELEAARRFVRKRRLGPHRSGALPERAEERDLQRLARAGFSFETAARALSEEP